VHFVGLFFVFISVSFRRCPVQRFYKTGNILSGDGEFIHHLTGSLQVSCS